MEKLVILGGAFNPPTIMHFVLANNILNEIENIDKVLFMPVSSNYKKNEMPVSNEHRFNMLQMICKDLNKIEVSRLELDYHKVLTTIETLRILKNKNPDKDIIFAMGTDNLKELEQWNNCQDILTEFKVLVFERDLDVFEEIIENSNFLKKNKNSLIKLDNNIRTNMSSTFVRKKIRDGKSVRFLVPDSVLSYIEKNKLYMEGIC